MTSLYLTLTCLQDKMKFVIFIVDIAVWRYNALTLRLYLWLLVVVQFNLIPFNSEWFNTMCKGEYWAYFNRLLYVPSTLPSTNKVELEEAVRRASLLECYLSSRVGKVS